MNQNILAILGPTAIGKSTLAIELAKDLNGEVIGLDSRQIYFGMNIGTAQPTIEEMQEIRHHLIGVRSPDESVAAGEYAEVINAVIVDVKQRDRVPIICGGAGLYYRALNEGIFEDSVSNLQIREKLENEYDKDPLKLLEQLITIDPAYSEIVHINNKKRLVRAMEIYQTTGKTPSEHFAEQKKTKQTNSSIYSVLLMMNRASLFKRICKRTQEMLANGLIEEVKILLSKYDANLVHPLDSIGYKQAIAHLNGELSYQEMVDEINIRTRQYAKRQMNWFKSESVDMVIELNGKWSLNEVVEKVISNVRLKQ